MARFAKLDENNVVIDRNVVHNNELLDENGNESEQKGIDFLTNLYGHTKWKQCSYNTYGGVHNLGGTPFRKNYPDLLLARYKIDKLINDPIKLLEEITKKRYGSIKGNLEMASLTLLNDYRQGLIGRVSLETPILKKNQIDQILRN